MAGEINKPQQIKKILEGTVISNQMNKTIVVSVVRNIQHPVYKKFVRRISKFKAHDPKNECGIGDVVQIIECRPLSRDKRWRLLKTIKKGNV